MKHKLPKQWKHWLALAKLKTRGRQPWQQWNFYGRGRHFRINCHGQFQVSQKFQEFDRWANSLWVTTEGIPKTRDEFLARVQQLLARANRKDRLLLRFREGATNDNP